MTMFYFKWLKMEYLEMYRLGFLMTDGRGSSVIHVHDVHVYIRFRLFKQQIYSPFDLLVTNEIIHIHVKCVPE